MAKYGRFDPRNKKKSRDKKSFRDQDFRNTKKQRKQNVKEWITSSPSNNMDLEDTMYTDQ